jgi:serine/threonine-protein kinase
MGRPDFMRPTGRSTEEGGRAPLVPRQPSSRLDVAALDAPFLGERARQLAACVPHWIGRYEVLLPIASGGMATVYLARSRGFGGVEREVALKLAHAERLGSGDTATELFEEARLAVRIHHPNVVPIFDVGADGGYVFLVMEYVEGDTLSAVSRGAAAAGAPLSPGVGLRILCDSLEGLHSAHELCDESGQPQSLVHRDFSPQNILIGLDGTGRLTDFGIATAATRVRHTRAGSIKGKISYMSPEQARGLPLDRRCDVWAAGVMAWELLAGRRLYADLNDDVTTLLRLVTTAPPPLRSVNPDVHPALAAVVADALTLDVSRRTSSALAFGSALAAACREIGLRLPEHAEVAEVVSRFIGPTVADRRARTKKVMAVRACARANARRATDANGVGPAVRLVPPATPLEAQLCVPFTRTTGGVVDVDPEVTETTTTPSVSATRASRAAAERGDAPPRARRLRDARGGVDPFYAAEQDSRYTVTTRSRTPAALLGARRSTARRGG